MFTSGKTFNPRHKDLEEEETTTDGEESKSFAAEASQSDEGNDDNDDEDDDDDDDDDDSDNEEEVPEPLAPNRLRRKNAGNKMAELMSSAIADDFYESAYNGGFKEDDVDDNFVPIDDEVDEVDSDFDRPEEEDEPASADENEEAVLRREKKLLLAKHKNWAVARFNKFTVNENVCDPKTQKQRLEEAKETEKMNIVSLKRFEEFELERKKRQVKPLQRQKAIGPMITIISKAEPIPSTIVIVPEVKSFDKPERREYHVCAVTGRPAKYIDPLTDLPYADLGAFRQIRASLDTYVQSSATKRESDGTTEPMDTTADVRR